MNVCCISGFILCFWATNQEQTCKTQKGESNVKTLQECPT